MEVINALGRRKTAVARIYMKAGSGNITVNKRDYKEYFPTSILHYVVEQPTTVVASTARPRLCVSPSAAPSARSTPSIVPP